MIRKLSSLSFCRLQMGSTCRAPLVLSIILVIVLGLMIPDIAGQPISSTNLEAAEIPVGIDLDLQANNVSEEAMRQTDETVRVDPLDNFKKYRGGFDITNKHYWASTIFTGVHGYALGVLWLLCGILFGCFLLAKKFCCKNRKSGKLRKRPLCHKNCHLWHIFLALFFMLFAIVALGLVLGGNAKFHSEAKNVVDIIINTASDASDTIYNTTGAIKQMRNNFEAMGNAEVSGFLTSTSEELDTGAAEIAKQAKKNRRLIDLGLKIVYIVTTVTISLTLVAVIALSVAGILKLRRPVILLITLCWLLTVMCWLFFGLYFFLAEFSGDTCTALENFQQNPNNNSLSSILPCDQLLSAKSVLYDVGSGISSLVDEVNGNLPADQNIAYVCNPFSEPPEYKYQPENCPADSVRIGDIPEVLKAYTCSTANNGTCGNGSFISNGNYELVEVYTTSIQNILNVYPGMESLVECQTVKDAFSDILLNHCKPMKRYAKMVWAAMVFLAVLMVLLVVLWTIQINHEQNHNFGDGSVKPDSAKANVLELGTDQNPSLV